MSVKNQHSQYTKFAGKWKRCRDTMNGQDAIHEAGTTYLPRLKGQDDADYTSMVKRTTFTNYTWRTIEGLRGMMFRLPPKIEVPAVVEDHLHDVTMDGKDLQTFMMKLVADALGIGRCGVLVDYPQANPTTTLADARLQNLRPYLVFCAAERIVNWKARRIANRTVLSMVVLEECRKIPDGEFSEKDQTVYRVLDLDESDLYRVRVFRINEKGEDELVEGPYTPLMAMKPLTFIPFQFIGADDNTWECDEPPLIDLVDVNLSHYRTNADYEHGCHFTGLPQPWVSGYQPEKNERGEVVTKLTIGSAQAWIFPEAEAKAEYLEFAGQGLGTLKDNLDRKEAQMAVLGARMLEPQKKGVETAEAAALHRGGEQSTLAAMAQNISIGMRKVLWWFASWSGAQIEEKSEELQFEMNREFYPKGIDSQMLTALVGAWQKGAFSHETLFNNLQKFEVVDKDTTFEDEEAKIEAEGPKMSPGLLPGLGAPPFGAPPQVDPKTGKPIPPKAPAVPPKGSDE